MSQSYKKNYLNQVILRLDFVDKIDLTSFKKFSSEVIDMLPEIERKDGEEGYVDFDLEKGEMKKNLEPITSWWLRDVGKTKIVKISPRLLVIEYSVYDNSAILYTDLSEIVKKFIDTFQVKTVKRVGLRYINKISLKEKNYTQWNKYINNDLLGFLNFESDKNVVRAMSRLSYKEDSGDITFNYGIWNSNYPNDITEKSFILDYDAYSIMPIDMVDEDVCEIIKLHHQHIENLFEASITEDFRKFLNEKDGK